MRTLSTYSRPPLATLLRTASSIEDLGKLRLSLIAGLRSGKIDATDKTKESWDAALWESVHRLMRENPRRAPYVFNFVLGWPKSPRFEAELAAYVKALVAPLPSDAELDAAAARAREIAAREVRTYEKFEEKLYEMLDAPDLTRSEDRSKPDDTNR